MLYIGVLNEISLSFLFGLQVPNVDLPPLCSSKFRPGPPGEQAQAASQFIADVIERYSYVIGCQKKIKVIPQILASQQIMFVKAKHYQGYYCLILFFCSAVQI